VSAEILLSRLDRPRRTGPETWIARCPAHKDRSPSMTVRECGDGRVLLHCFAGCETGDVLAAVGLEFDALFPPKPLGERMAPTRRPFPAADVLEALMHDALTLQQLAIAIQESGQATAEQRQKIGAIAARIVAARDCIHG
jgi:hypothetical protein